MSVVPHQEMGRHDLFCYAVDTEKQNKIMKCPKALQQNQIIKLCFTILFINTERFWGGFIKCRFVLVRHT